MRLFNTWLIGGIELDFWVLYKRIISNAILIQSTPDYRPRCH